MLTGTVVSSSDIQINNELCHESFFSTKTFQAQKYLLEPLHHYELYDCKFKNQK